MTKQAGLNIQDFRDRRALAMSQAIAEITHCRKRLEFPQLPRHLLKINLKFKCSNSRKQQNTKKDYLDSPNLTLLYCQEYLELGYFMS
jgi:hypothetical protein